MSTKNTITEDETHEVLQSIRKIIHRSDILGFEHSLFAFDDASDEGQSGQIVLEISDAVYSKTPSTSNTAPGLEDVAEIESKLIQLEAEELMQALLT